MKHDSCNIASRPRTKTANGDSDAERAFWRVRQRHGSPKQATIMKMMAETLAHLLQHDIWLRFHFWLQVPVGSD